MSSTIQDLNLDLQSQDETVVQKALDDLQSRDLVDLDPRLSQTLLVHCSDKLLSANIALRAGALCVLVKLLRQGESGEIGVPSSAASQRSSRSSRAMSNHAEVLAKKIQTPSTLDLQVGSTGDMENYEKYHSNLCKVITELQTRSPRKFMPGFKPIAQYLVQCTANDSCTIATAGCEYWAKLSVPPVPGKMMDHWVPSVLSKLQAIIPALLSNMVYHVKHIEYLEGGNLAENVPAEIEEFSNRRNFAALGFENLCRIFPNETTAIFKPQLEKRINSKKWQDTEAVLLALSAYTQAAGVPKEMAALYPTLMPKLLEFYTHPQPLMRSIACFTMQHFINRPIKGVKDPFAKMLKCSSRLLSDSCPEVQVMAIRSLASMLAYSERDVAPYKDSLIQSFSDAGNSLKGEASFPLYESIGHMYGRMGPLLEEQESQKLLKPVLDHWDKISLDGAQNSEEVMLICQPLCVIIMHSRAAFKPYNSRILNKVTQFLDSVTQNGGRGEGGNNEEINTKLVSLLDLTSALFEGQGSDMSDSVSSSQLVQKCLNLLTATSLDASVHQSTLAVIGHIARHAYASLRGSLPQILSIIEAKLASKSTPDSLKNNALWALSFIIQNEQNPNEQILSLANVIMEHVKQLDGDEGVVINAASAITNLCAAWPDKTFSLLTKGEMFGYLCALLQVPFPREGEKEGIIKNLCKVLEPNLNKIARDRWSDLCIVAATLDTQDQKCINAVTSLLKNLRSHLGNKGWNVVSQQIGAQMAISLRKRYKLY